MSCDLSHTDAAAWSELTAAAVRPESGFRYLSLSTVDRTGRPQARMLVLRRADTARRELEFHTDVRSKKWLELTENPVATVLGFCPQLKVQLRLEGVITLQPPDSEYAGHIWSTLPVWTRQTYTGESPGTTAIPDTMVNVPGPTLSGETNGRRHFGIVTMRAHQLDWFRLQRQNNRRAGLTYDPQGRLVHSQWLNP